MSKINEEETKNPQTEETVNNGPQAAEQTAEEAPKSRKELKKEKKLVEELQEKNTKLEAENAKLAAELAKLKAELDKEKADYLRLMADVDNIRKKSAEDRLDLVKTASSDVIKGLLPVLDDCDQALKILENSADEAAKEGTNLIYTKLLGYLKTKGLEPIEALGKPFDTDEHEALTQLPAPSEEMKGKVIEVFQQGYRLGGKILRFAKVVVGA